MQKISVLLIALIMLISCRLPCNNSEDLEIVNKKSELKFLTGNYVVDNQNKRGIDYVNEIKLTVNVDSTYILYNYPIGTIDQSSIKNAVKDTILGTWHSNYLDTYYTASFSINYSKNPELNYYPRSWSVYKKDNKPVLVVEFDDPDLCYYMRFIKL
jgi:hypothetical protein